MHVLASYPSGITLSVHGEWKLIETEADLMPTMAVDGRDKATGSAFQTTFVFDRRAIVMDGIRILYSPRRNGDKLSQSDRDWLAEHPEWDRLPESKKAKGTVG